MTIEELASEVAASAMRPQPGEKHLASALRARWTAKQQRDAAIAERDEARGAAAAQLAHTLDVERSHSSAVAAARAERDASVALIDRIGDILAHEVFFEDHVEHIFADHAEDVPSWLRWYAGTLTRIEAEVDAFNEPRVAAMEARSLASDGGKSEERFRHDRCVTSGKRIAGRRIGRSLPAREERG